MIQDPSAFKPESLMMSYGYNPKWSEGAVKCPIFQTSTFVFESAEDGKAFFEVAYGKREADEGEKNGLIYSRLNNPDLQILEERLCLWDKAEDAAVFESGMSAISTVFMEFLKPGALLLHGSPTYGGTDHFIHHILPKWGVQTLSFDADDSFETILERVEASGKADQLALIYLETPANPTNTLFDLAMCRKISDHFQQKYAQIERAPVAVDNTYLGPIWQNPLAHGCDLVIYSATKYLGGHSDLIAGAVLGHAQNMQRIKVLRTFYGNMAGPWTGWLLMRSLETLKIRMQRQSESAMMLAKWLSEHPKVEKVLFPGLLKEGDKGYNLYKKYCSGPGAMISFYIKGNEKEAFAFLNHLKLAHLAVSLGSTESLAQHPASMTHCDMSYEDQQRLGITDNLVRFSVGVEAPEDLIKDMEEAFLNV